MGLPKLLLADGGIAMTEPPHPDQTRGQAERDADPGPTCPECGAGQEHLEREPANYDDGLIESPAVAFCNNCGHEWRLP